MHFFLMSLYRQSVASSSVFIHVPKLSSTRRRKGEEKKAARTCFVPIPPHSARMHVIILTLVSNTNNMMTVLASLIPISYMYFAALTHGRSCRVQCSGSSGGTEPASLPSSEHEDKPDSSSSHARINFGRLIE